MGAWSIAFLFAMALIRPHDVAPQMYRGDRALKMGQQSLEVAMCRPPIKMFTSVRHSPAL